MIDSELLDRLEKALCLFYGEDNLTDAIVRILVDMRHLCDRKAASFVALARSGRARTLLGGNRPGHGLDC